MSDSDLLKDLPRSLSVEEILKWLLEHAPELAEKLLAHFRDPEPAAKILEGDGYSDAELNRRRKAT